MSIRTGRHYTIVSVRLKAGSFLAMIAEDQTVHAQASSRPLAEKNAALCTSTSSRRSRTGTRAGRNHGINPTRRPDLTQFLKVRVVRDKETGQYETHVPELNGNSTCGSTKEEALQRTDESVAT